MDSLQLPKKKLDTLSEYYFYHNQFKQIYGDKGLVLYHNGTFYEIYAKTREELLVYSHILNFHIAKKEFSQKISGFMIGIQVNTATKHISRLLEHDLIILLVSQFDDPLGSTTKIRKPTVIYSPGAPPIECETNEIESNTTVVCYIDQKGIGICAVDLLTGELEVTSNTTNSQDFFYTFLYKFADTQEIIVYTDHTIDWLPDKTTVLEWTTPKVTLESVLEQVYTKNGMNTLTNELGLDHCEYLQKTLFSTFVFIQNHNSVYLRHLEPPKVTNDKNTLYLPKNTLAQLNVTGDSKQTIFGLLSNELSTALGRRKLKYTLSHPFTNTHQIQTRYNFTELVKQLDIPIVKKHLKGIYDITKLLRKLSLGELSVFDLQKLYHSFDNTRCILDLLNETAQEQFGIDDFQVQLNNAHNYILDTININNFNNESNHCFIESKFPSIDAANVTLGNAIQALNDHAKQLSKDYIDSTKVCLNVTYNNKIGWTLNCTKIRGTILEKNATSESLEYTKNKTNYSINSPKIKQLSNAIIKAQLNFDNVYESVWNEFKTNLFDLINNSQNDIFTFIELLDISVCNAEIAKKYNYSQPTLVNSHKSFVKYTKLRHPLAERIINTKYITHDISLNYDSTTGILLYGINASGKSMLLRSVGLALVMAQSGLYVPCDNMELSVYHSVVSQVDLTDNFYKHSSSFMVEVQGIKNIIAYADNHTIVLADELCKGTESTSGASILGSLIFRLLEKNCSFLFTTHLHELTKVKMITELPKLRICHLSIEKKDGCLVFNRHLNEGPSECLYGIKVAESMNLDKPFISIANEICDILVDNKQTTLELDPKKSRYNAKKRVTKCEICNFKPKKNEIPLDTHHINFQCTADSSGFINEYHKNVKGNLVVLCKQCHQSVHSGIIHIDGYKNTTKGVQLIWEKV